MAVSKIAKIIAKKRAEDIAKKKVAKVPAGQARFVAKEEMKSVGKRPGRKISKRTGLSPEERKEVLVKRSIKKIENTRPRNPRDVVFGRVISKEEIRKKLATPPTQKGTSKRNPVQLTRGAAIAKRSEVEEVMAKRMTKQERRSKLEAMLKKMDPADRKRIEARVQVKRAQRDENAGLTKFGMDVKPRKQLDDRVVERAKELTAQERNEIARKEAIEFGQRRESDRRIQDGLKEIARRERLLKETDRKTTKYLNKKRGN